MENFLPKMTQEGVDDKKQIFVSTNGRQFEGQSLRVPKQEKMEASNAQEQALPMTLHSMQEKMNQNSRETSTKVSHILKKIERVDKELATLKSENLACEMLQINMIDDMRDAIGELKNNMSDLIDDLRMNKEYTSTFVYQLWVIKDDVKKVTKNLKDFQQEEDLEDETLADDITDIKDEISEVKDEMSEVRDTLKDLERRDDELMVVKVELKSLKDAMKNVTNELKSVKDVAANLKKDMTCELNNVKEELWVVMEKTRDANAAQNKMEGVQEGMLCKLQKVMDKVSCVKKDLEDIWVEVTDEHGMDVGGRLQDVRHELKNIKHEMRAAKDEQRKLTNADLDLIKEFNDTIRNAQNIEPTLGDLREVMTNLNNNKKRKQDPRHSTFKQNKRLRKQSNHSDERANTSSLSASRFRMSTSSLDSDSR